MSSFDPLTNEIVERADLGARIEALLSGLADRIKSTSNDQNVQKLSRELRAAVPKLVEAVTDVESVGR